MIRSYEASVDMSTSHFKINFRKIVTLFESPKYLGWSRRTFPYPSCHCFPGGGMYGILLSLEW